MNNETKSQQIEKIANDILISTESSIIINLRFLQCAMANIKWVQKSSSAMIASDGQNVYYDPALVIRRFKINPNLIVRTYLHVLLHFIFHNDFEYENKQSELWDIACDISVENTIMEMGLFQTTLKDDPERLLKLKVLKERAGGLHTAALYRLFLVEEPSIREMEELTRLFKRDEHFLWVKTEENIISIEQWKKISERIKADLKSFSKSATDSESLRAALEDATREKINYSDFLKKFMTRGEQIHISEDEFDYIYYTYGLSTYGNMPLIEPLEYADVNKIKEFVIAIDTSASCKGDLVKEFLKRTIQIMSDAENFFNTFNVHILQCDYQVRKDTVITEKKELDEFLQNADLTGFGSTDFTPVFEYVDGLIEHGELKNLKGLIYFTDGYGIYPERMPEYETAFVFLSDDGNAPNVPNWAIRLVLDEEQILK